MKYLILILIASIAHAGTDFKKYRFELSAQKRKQFECEAKIEVQLLKKWPILDTNGTAQIDAQAVCETMFPLPPIPPECEEQ